MGLPGSGKTYLAKRLQPLLKAAWYNADIVREMANDWDFSPEGRIRQSLRMKSLADFEKSHGRIEAGRFEDTNKMFEEPKDVNFRITEMNDENHEFIAKEILKNV